MPQEISQQEYVLLLKAYDNFRDELMHVSEKLSENHHIMTNVLSEQNHKIIEHLTEIERILDDRPFGDIIKFISEEKKINEKIEEIDEKTTELKNNWLSLNDAFKKIFYWGAGILGAVTIIEILIQLKIVTIHWFGG